MITSCGMFESKRVVNNQPQTETFEILVRFNRNSTSFTLDGNPDEIYLYRGDIIRKGYNVKDKTLFSGVEYYTVE